MIKKIIFVLQLLLVVIFISCSEDEPTAPDPIINVPNATLSDIQQKVFTPGCALAGCHGATNNQANLLLTEGNSFSNLVDVQSFLYPQFKRVEPSNSINSLIIKILRGEVAPRMPLDRDPLPQAVIDTIAAWINNGAPNN
jgi:hypothetical protein